MTRAVAMILAVYLATMDFESFLFVAILLLWWQT
jgi:hypothetical protein